MALAKVWSLIKYMCNSSSSFDNGVCMHDWCLATNYVCNCAPCWANIFEPNLLSRLPQWKTENEAECTCIAICAVNHFLRADAAYYQFQSKPFIALAAHVLSSMSFNSELSMFNTNVEEFKWSTWKRGNNPTSSDQPIARHYSVHLKGSN